MPAWCSHHLGARRCRRSDDDEDAAPEPDAGPEPEPGTGVNLMLKADGAVSGSHYSDVINAEPPADAPDWRFSGELSAHGGDDQISGAYENAQISAGAGDDQIDADLRNSQLDMGTGADRFEGLTGGTEVRGGGGADVISGGFGQSTLHGGLDDDELSGWLVATQVYGGGGDDGLTFIGEDSTLYGGDGNDVINAEGLVRSTVHGGAGDDVIHIKPVLQDQGGISVDGGNGDDILEARTSYGDNTAVPQLRGGEGDDIFDLAVDLPTASPPSWNDRPVLQTTLATITDFTPGDDTLRLEISGAPTQVTLSPLAFGVGTKVSIHFMAAPYGDGDEPLAEVPHVAEITLVGATGVTLADIEVIPAPAALTAA